MNALKAGLLCLSFLSLSSLIADCHGKNHNKKELQPSCPKFFGHCRPFMVGGDAALAFDYFRSLPDGSFPGNSGAFASINLGIGIPKEEYGLGAQVGGSYGLYDWDGRSSNTTGNTKALQQQAFVTGGLFRMTPKCFGVNAGLVYDFMFNRKFGVFALNPNIGQLRAQVGYLIEGGNEVGAWGTYGTPSSHKESNEAPISFRAISQANLFWSHYFKNRSQVTLWGGTPYRRGLMYTDGRAGRYILGANFRAPLTTALSVFGHGAYMPAISGTGPQESRNYAANVCFGVNYSFGGCKAGERPYLPLADNSNFLVDTNSNQ